MDAALRPRPGFDVEPVGRSRYITKLISKQIRLIAVATAVFCEARPPLGETPVTDVHCASHRQRPVALRRVLARRPYRPQSVRSSSDNGRHSPTSATAWTADSCRTQRGQRQQTLSSTRSARAAHRPTQGAWPVEDGSGAADACQRWVGQHDCDHRRGKPCDCLSRARRAERRM